MAVVKTSAQAYLSLLLVGYISDIQHELLKFVLVNKEVSRADAEEYFSDQNQSYGPRFVELERKGLLKRLGTKPSCKTNRTVQCWTTTNTYDTEHVDSKLNSPKQIASNLCQVIKDVCASPKLQEKHRAQLIKAVAIAELQLAK